MHVAASCSSSKEQLLLGDLPGLTMGGFRFDQRSGRINWRVLAGLSVEKIIREVDIDTIQRQLEHITFSDADELLSFADPHFVKLFQLAQLALEYLLWSQDKLVEYGAKSSKANHSLKKKLQVANERLTTLSTEVNLLKRELRQQKRTTTTYEVMLTQPQGIRDSTDGFSEFQPRCPICKKTFESPVFLEKHFERRHPQQAKSLKEWLDRRLQMFRQGGEEDQHKSVRDAMDEIRKEFVKQIGEERDNATARENALRRLHEQECLTLRRQFEDELRQVVHSSEAKEKERNRIAEQERKAEWSRWEMENQEKMRAEFQRQLSEERIRWEKQMKELEESASAAAANAASAAVAARVSVPQLAPSQGKGVKPEPISAPVSRRGSVTIVPTDHPESDDGGLCDLEIMDVQDDGEDKRLEAEKRELEENMNRLRLEKEQQKQKLLKQEQQRLALEEERETRRKERQRANELLRKQLEDQERETKEFLAQKAKRLAEDSARARAEESERRREEKERQKLEESRLEKEKETADRVAKLLQKAKSVRKTFDQMREDTPPDQQFSCISSRSYLVSSYKHDPGQIEAARTRIREKLAAELEDLQVPLNATELSEKDFDDCIEDVSEERKERDDLFRISQKKVLRLLESGVEREFDGAHEDRASEYDSVGAPDSYLEDDEDYVAADVQSASDIGAGVAPQGGRESGDSERKTGATTLEDDDSDDSNAGGGPPRPKNQRLIRRASKVSEFDEDSDELASSIELSHSGPGVSRLGDASSGIAQSAAGVDGAARRLRHETKGGNRTRGRSQVRLETKHAVQPSSSIDTEASASGKDDSVESFALSPGSPFHRTRSRSRVKNGKQPARSQSPTESPQHSVSQPRQERSQVNPNIDPFADTDDDDDENMKPAGSVAQAASGVEMGHASDSSDEDDLMNAMLDKAFEERDARKRSRTPSDEESNHAQHSGPEKLIEASDTHLANPGMLTSVDSLELRSSGMQDETHLTRIAQVEKASSNGSSGQVQDLLFDDVEEIEML
eukprot:Rmarinus@m.14884